MSRSSYRETTTEDRDYETRRERERERSRAAYDEGESRHHGKWTASSETADLEGSGHSAPRKSLSRKDSRERLDRDRDHDSDRRRSRGYDSYHEGGYGSNIPTPPPMPPANFWQPHGMSSGYGSQYGGYGSHPGLSSGYGNHYGGYGSHYGGLSSGYGSPGYGSHYGGLSSGYGSSGYGSHYGTRSLDHGDAYGLSSGYGSHYGAGYGSGYGSGYESYGQDSYALSHPSLSRGMHPIQRAFLAQGGHPHVEHHNYSQGRSRSLSGSGLSGLGLGLGHQQGYGHQLGYGHQQGYGQQYGESSHPYHIYEQQGFHMTRPHADIYELGNDYIIELDLPGHTRDHVDIKLSGNELYVISKPPKRDYNWHVNERWLGRHNVERKFYLPADVTGASIAPVLSNGVLRLTLPRNIPAASTSAAAVAATQPHGKTTTTNDSITTTTSTVQATTL